MAGWFRTDEGFTSGGAPSYTHLKFEAFLTNALGWSTLGLPPSLVFPPVCMATELAEKLVRPCSSFKLSSLIEICRVGSSGQAESSRERAN